MMRKRAARGLAALKASPEEADVDDELEEEEMNKLERMTELEREMYMFNRGEERRRERERKRLLQQTEEKASKGARPVRSTRELKEDSAKKSAIQELKAARQRKARSEKLVEDSEQEEEQGVSEEGEMEGVVDNLPSDDEYFQGRRRYLEEEDDEEASLEDIRSVQVRRAMLEAWYDEPFFKATLPGCFVKVRSSENKRGRDGQSVASYFLVQVLDVEERPPGMYKDTGQAWKSPYPFGSHNMRTSIWLRVARGFSERYWPLSLVSNHGIEEKEFEKWQEVCRLDKRPPIMQGEVREVLQRIKKAISYTYTAEDVAVLLEEKRRKGTAPKNVALERAKLERERDAAAEAGDQERLEQIEARLAHFAALSRQSGTGAMAALNKKNAQKNFKAAFSNSVTGDGKNDAVIATLDPFSRRATRSRVYWNTKGNGDEGGGLRNGVAPSDTIPTGVAHIPGKSPEKKEMVVDLSGLDLSLLKRKSAIPMIAKKLLGSGRIQEPSRDTRLISLREYKSRY